MAETQPKGKGDTLVKLLMVLCVSLLSFSVGTFIGKKTTEKSMERAALEADADENAEKGENERDIASIPPGSTEVKPDEALTNEELAQLTDDHKAEKNESDSGKEKEKKEKGSVAELVESEESTKSKTTQKADAARGAAHETNHNKPAEKSQARTESRTDSRKEVAAKFKHNQEAADRVVRGQDPSAPVAEGKTTTARLPSSLPAQVATSTVGKFTVQISSHQTEDEAKKRASDLKSRGFDAFYIKADINGKTWYRVSVGTFTSPKEARNYVDTLKKDAGVNAAFVQKITQ